MRVKVYIFLCVYLVVMINRDNDVLGYRVWVKLYSAVENVTAQQIALFKHKTCFSVSYYNGKIIAALVRIISEAYVSINNDYINESG